MQIFNLNRIPFFIFAFLCIAIGIYPVIYFFMPSDAGLLGTKTPDLLSRELWWAMFYMHIAGGGISLLAGWSQFSEKFRNKNLIFHQRLGKIYLISVVFSGSAAIYISFFATGGFISGLGFFCLGVVWLVTSILAYNYIRKGDIKQHQVFMILSFSCAFAAVTLRIWNPLLIGLTGDFISAYTIVAWLCWVPNLAVAFLIIKKRKLIGPYQTKN